MSPFQPSEHAPQARRHPVAALAFGLAVVVGLTWFGVSRAGGNGDRGAATRASYDQATKSLTFSLPAFAGGTVSKQFAGKPLVLNFYAS